MYGELILHIQNEDKFTQHYYEIIKNVRNDFSKFGFKHVDDIWHYMDFVNNGAVLHIEEDLCLELLSVLR